MLALALLALTATTASAEVDPPIATDRPGNGNAATVVPHLRFQAETSWSFAEIDDDFLSLMSWPTLFRFGLVDVAEIRLGTAVVGTAFVGSPAPPGSPPRGESSTDTLVGAKVQLLANEGFRPDLAVMLDVFLPTGEGAFTQDVVVPELRVASAWSLPAGFGLLLNAGVDLPQGQRPIIDEQGVTTEDQRFGQLIYVANLGYAFPFLEQRLSVFVESFGRVVFDRELGSNIHQFDTGAAFRITDDVQVDSFLQVGLNDAAPNYQLSIGVSFRI